MNLTWTHEHDKDGYDWSYTIGSSLTIYRWHYLDALRMWNIAASRWDYVPGGLGTSRRLSGICTSR